MLLTSQEQFTDDSLAIHGVTIKQLKTFPDDRGFFREIVRSTDEFFAEGFAQWSHSKMGKDTVKAWHYHHRQIDWWYLGIGVIHTVLYDNREESPSYQRMMQFKMGEQELDPEALSIVVKIPQGVLHGCKVISPEAHLFYITSETYNPNDEGRIPFNEFVPHSWGEESSLTVAENDRRYFEPTASRAPNC